MKYLTLMIYLFSYTTGFANLGFHWVAWLRTRDRSFLLFLLFLVFFTAKLVVFNAEFFLEALLGWAPIRGTEVNLVLVSLVATGFNAFLVLFLRSLVSLPWSRGMSIGVACLALSPLGILVVSPWTGSTLADLGVETLLDSALLLFVTWYALTRRRQAKTVHGRQVMVIMATLNLVYFPLALLKGLTDSWFHYDPRWFQLGNAYYFVGNLWLGIHLVRHQFLAPRGGEPMWAAEAHDAETFRAWGITEREAEVITLLGQGLPNKAIAARLFISPGTVKNHLYNIYQKTGVQTRIELLNLVRSTPNVTNGTSPTAPHTP